MMAGASTPHCFRATWVPAATLQWLASTRPCPSVECCSTAFSIPPSSTLATLLEKLLQATHVPHESLELVQRHFAVVVQILCGILWMEGGEPEIGSKSGITVSACTKQHTDRLDDNNR